MKNKTIMAILYDFDKTLSTTDMQNYAFIPALGMTPDEFWGATGVFSDKTGVERILSYMYMMVKLAKEKGLHLTKEQLREFGTNVKYYPGVEDWFKRINEYGEEKGVHVEHYLISSGTKEILEGTSIAKEFKEIYGCEFLFDEETHEPIWPKLAINFTQKTQYFFRIHKGVLDVNDDKGVNAKLAVNRVPYENMVYLGDGMTDVPSMVLVKQNGGKAIAIYTKKDKKVMQTLTKSERVNYCCLADYRENSQLDDIMKMIIDKISINSIIAEKEAKVLEKVLAEIEKDE